MEVLICLYVLVFAAAAGAIWYVVKELHKVMEVDRALKEVDRVLNEFHIPDDEPTSISDITQDDWQAELKDDHEISEDDPLPTPVATRPETTFYWDPEYVREKKAKRKKKAKKAAKKTKSKKKTKKLGDYEF